MKTISSAALTELMKLEGTEPLIIVGIEWTENNVTYYADKEILGVEGRLLAIGTIESIVVGDNRSSQNVELQLDDTDGTIKSIIDHTNIYKVNCTVYQFFGALTDLSDKFIIFKGQIQTPFTWDELQRSVTLTVLSEIESYEVGFSPEEGQLDFVTDENIGKPWPLCFGSVVHVPAQRVGKSIEGYATGNLDEDFSVVDPMLQWKLDNLVFAYNQEKFLLYWWLLVIRGAKSIGRTSKTILTEYIATIIQERQVFSTILLIVEELDKTKKKVKEGAAHLAASVKSLEQTLEFMAFVSNATALKKEELERETEMANFVQQLVKNAYNQAIDSYNNLRQIYTEYVAVTNEICRQSQTAKETIRIRNGSTFPQGQEIEILINNVRFRGTFDGELFHILAGPLATFTDPIPVDEWVKDPDPCATTDETNGLNIFWLKNDPPENLVGMYLLVKARGEEGYNRHIIKVERQEGKKVVFSLVNWANGTGGGQPEGMTIDDAVGQLLEAPMVQTPFGIVPADLFAGGWRFDQRFGPVADLNGVWAGSPWNTPEGIAILKICAGISGGVSRHELEVIAHLVYNVQYEALGNDLLMFEPTARAIYTIIGEDIGEVSEACPIVLKKWMDTYTIPYEEIPDTMEWTADSGASVSTSAKDCDVYIANILPSTIKAVFAYRTLPNTSQRVLAQVPSSYYVKNENANLGTINVTALTFPRALKNIAGENWEDDVYVTLESSVGPNICDIIQHLVETYTDGTVNTANFDAIRDKFRNDDDEELYPANFALFDRPNVLVEIARIAWESRCAIYRVGNEFFLKYLSEEPDEDVTFSESDIDDVGHLRVTYASTDDITTRMIATWHPDYKPLEEGQKPYRIVLRHNIKLYGLHESEVEFHIYNNKELVEKSATFWMIRKSNAWKRIEFNTFLHNLRLDTFDCIKFGFSHTFLSSSDVKGVILNLNYNPNDNSIGVVCEVPVKAGEMAKYDLYWPANVPEATIFPTAVEIEKGYAGGFGPGSGVTGTINDC